MAEPRLVPRKRAVKMVDADPLRGDRPGVNIEFALTPQIPPLGAIMARRAAPRLRPALFLLEERVTPATITVNSALDTVAVDGVVTLREALQSINSAKDANADVTGGKSGSYGSNDTVIFAVGLAGPIALTAGAGRQLAISNPVAIVGPGSGQLTIQNTAPANANSRVFYLTNFFPVTISGLTVTGGNVTGRGGGLVHFGTGSVTLTDMIFTANTATGSGGAISNGSTGSIKIVGSLLSANSVTGAGNSGGAIHCQGAGTVQIENSTVSGNSAPFAGGGINMYSGGTLSVTASTLSGNTAGRGGGLAVAGASGNWTVRNSTLSANRAGSAFGGGIAHIGGTLNLQNSTLVLNSAATTGGGLNRGTNTVNIESSIIATNTASTSGDDLNGTIAKAYNCLIGVTDGATFTASKNLKSGTKASPLDPLLGSLQNNGGPTFTHLPGPTSPAIDNGTNPASLSTDQRGAGFARTSGITTDIGAVEVQSAVTAPPTAAGAAPGVSAAGGTAHTITVNYADDVGIDTATLGSADITVIGPGGPVPVVFAGSTGGGKAVTASYVMTPPGGAWDAGDNGSYTITVVASQVADLDAPPQFVAAGAIGSFSVAIPRVLTVTAANDEQIDTDGKLSLREAVALANAGPSTTDSITFDPLVFIAASTITLGLGELLITDSLSITGPAARVTISGGAKSRVLHLAVPGSGSVALTQLTLTAGNNSLAAGILANDDDLTLTRCVVAAHYGPGVVAPTAAGTWTITESTIADNLGTGLSFPTSGTLIIEASTISGNSTSGAGGGINTASSTTIRNSTISGNTAGGAGGGINMSVATVTVQNSTITGNSAGSTGGGIQRGNTGSLTVTSSAIAGNSAPTGPDINGTTTTFNFSLISNSAGATLSGTNNLINISARLGPLSDNGGPTMTHLPLAASPLRDAGSNPASLTTDQRGVGFARLLQGQVDIGAVESSSVAPGAEATAANVTISGGTSHTLTVVYSDLESAIDTASLGSADLSVIGPGGSLPVTFVGFTGGGKSVTATYTLVPPGGTWNGQDCGTYTITMTGGQVFDSDSPTKNSVAAGAIGSFTVSLPTTWTVTLVADEDDGNTTASDLSLREAIRLANECAPAADTITFDTAVFASSQTILLTLGELKITDSVTIVGPGAGLVTIDAGSKSRIFHIDVPGAVGAVNLSGMTLRNAAGSGTGTLALGDGGAIFSRGEKLSLTDMVVRDSTAKFGAGLLMVGSGGSATITKSQFLNNTALSNGSGGLLFSAPGGAISVELRDSVISGHAGPIPGIFIPYTTANSTILVEDSTITGNTGTLFTGGAMYLGAVTSNATVRRSTIANNASPYGGGIGAIYSAAGSLLIEATTISNNRATGATDSAGGGVAIFSTDIAVTIRNSTVSGNSAQYGGGIALSSPSGNLVVQNSTVTGNVAALSGGGLDSDSATSTIVFESTILSGNGSPVGPAARIPGVLTAKNIAIDSTAGIATFTDVGGASKILSLAGMKLGPLGNHGGPTQTHRLLTGSPLIGAGLNPAGLTTDQRGTGFPRVVGGIDIGAYEVQPPVVSQVIVNNGAIQRSRVTSVQVHFDQVVSLPVNPTDAFQLLRTSDNAAVTLAASVDHTGLGTVVTLTFVGGAVQSGSLADGLYSLRVVASQVSNDSSALDGNGDRTPGDDYVLVGTPGNTFFRLFGDADGSGQVNAADFLAFRLAFLGSSPTFDIDASGQVDSIDFLGFRLNFLKSI